MHLKKTVTTGALVVTLLTASTLAIAQHATQDSMQPAKMKSAPNAGNNESAARAPEAILVVFHADWCPSCQALGPKLEKGVMPEVKDESFLVVELDFTDRNSNQGEYMLSALGLGHLWEQFGRKTGFAVLVDAQTKQVIQRYGPQNSTDEMVKGIKQASAD